MAISVSNNFLWYVKDFQNIWKERDGRFSILSLDYETISNILSFVNLNVKNEYFVWKAIYDWINFDKDRRLEHLPDLIKNCLRFGRLDKHFIDSFIFECDLFTALPDAVQSDLKDFISNGFQTCQQTTAPSFNLNNLLNVRHFFPRFTEPILVCINNDNGRIGFYDNNYKCWWSLPMSLKFQRQTHYQLVMLGRKLYAFGGQDNTDKSLNLMWSRDLSDPSSQWRARADMNQSRKDFCSVVLNDTIYALGGWDGNRYLRSCERYCSQLNEWSTVADMNSDFENASAAVINGCIYVAEGGRWHDRSVWKYCPETDTWRKVAPMTTYRKHLTLTPFAGRLWAIGGWNKNGYSLSSCESYDPVTDTWREEAEMKVGRDDFAAIEFNGELYVVGSRRSRDGETKLMKKSFYNKHAFDKTFLYFVLESTKIEKYVPNIKKWVEDSTLQNLMYTPQLLIIPPICSSFFTTDPNQ